MEHANDVQPETLRPGERLISALNPDKTAVFLGIDGAGRYLIEIVGEGPMAFTRTEVTRFFLLRRGTRP